MTKKQIQTEYNELVVHLSRLCGRLILPADFEALLEQKEVLEFAARAGEFIYRKAVPFVEIVELINRILFLNREMFKIQEEEKKEAEELKAMEAAAKEKEVKEVQASV